MPSAGKYPLRSPKSAINVDQLEQQDTIHDQNNVISQ